jgi:hypothetical protein
MKKSQPLAKRYGTLTVLGEETKDGRRVATVKCRCGRAKEVLVDSLLYGRTKSCGRGACKTYPRVEFDPDYKPAAPRACSLETVRKAWDRYNHEKPEQRRTVVQLAKIHNVNANTLTSLFRSVRRAGGIDAYVSKLEKTDAQA